MRSRLAAVESLPPAETETGLPQLATPREISAACRISRVTVYSLIRRGRLPAVKLGSAVRVRVSDVRALLEGRR